MDTLPLRAIYQRSAGPTDPNTSPGDTLWQILDRPEDDPSDGMIWLTPRDVVQFGLTDAMREALGREEPEPPEPELGPEALEELPLPESGATEDWRWDVMADEELVSISNKPMVERLAKAGERPPALQQGVFPLELLKYVCGLL
jgi:hypothetical protein